MSKKKQKQKSKRNIVTKQSIASITTLEPLLASTSGLRMPQEADLASDSTELKRQDWSISNLNLQQRYLEQAALIAALETQNLAAQNQLQHQLDIYLVLQAHHTELQGKYAQQNQQIEVLHQKIASLEQSLAVLHIEPTEKTSPADATLIEQLTHQVTCLKVELAQQQQAKLVYEETVQTLKQELQAQTATLSMLQAQLSELRAAAQIGEAHLNRWRSRSFRG